MHTPPDKSAKRRQDRRRSSRWTAAILAAGAVLLLFGGYVQFKGDSSSADQSSQPQPKSPVATARSSQPASKLKPPASTAGTPTAGTPTAKPPKTSAEPKKSPSARPKAGTPVRVSVPSLGISARVLGIRARGGALIPPANPRLVGWWSDGARPGAAKGSAIITGHTVHNGGGAFDDLEQLGAGDTVTVSTGKGTIKYSVVGVAVYRKGALAKQATRLFDQGVAGRLVLVTCEDWDGSKYLSNAVVIAKPVS